MDSREEEQLIKRTLEMTEENNKILRKMQRAARWQRVFRIAYWAIVIAFSLGIYYVIQPYLESFKGVYSGLHGSTQSIQETLGSLPGLEGFFNAGKAK